MATVTSIASVRKRKKERSSSASGQEGFEPCSQDMTICGDCEGNRAKMKCPRLKEWAAKKR